MRIAIIGTGISGNVCSYLLNTAHDITVYEAADHIGGHTHTHDIYSGDKSYAVDSGFIVFNEKTYPNFLKLLKKLGVAWQSSDMSFSVKAQDIGLEYKPTNIGSLFAQRRNFLKPPFYRMLRDILKFRKDLMPMVGSRDYSLNLGEFMKNKGYGGWLLPYFVLPLGSAIWSAAPDIFLEFPIALYASFYANHGFLNVRDQPQWLVIKGGSREYVRALTRDFKDKIRLSCPVRSVRRKEDFVEVKVDGANWERFDHVIIATHSDQALSMLKDPSPQEREILSAIPYQPNRTTMHTDVSVLPENKKAWASWNCLIPKQAGERATLTYSMNRLQGLDALEQFCVSLNMDERLNARLIIKSMDYEHPVYTKATAKAQQRWGEISGKGRTHFCGAYWGYGFHEDGAKSGLAVCRTFGLEL